VDDARGFLRRLLPFPSSAPGATLHQPLESTRTLVRPSTIAVPAAGQQAAAIVSEAASILDEEMAKGVLAARGAYQPARHQGADQTADVIRAVHDLVDNIGRIWPTVQKASALTPGTPAAAADSGSQETLPLLKPASPVRAGQRGTFAMVLRNSENQAVRLKPISTDLIGGSGGRISSGLLEFSPGDVRLDPGEQRELQGRIAVPAATAPGCYFGLLVVGGIDYLRALIEIEVSDSA